jgi:hypothetical protein
MLSKTINGKTYLFVEVPETAKIYRIQKLMSSWLLMDDDRIFQPQPLGDGDFSIIGKASELTEEQWGEIVEPVSFAGKTYFHNYLASSRDFRDIVEAAFGTAKESGLSLLLTILPTLETSPETTLIIQKLC